MDLQQPRGIQETRELFKSGADLVEAVRISREDDGRLTTRDLANFIQPLLGLPTAINGAEQIPAELRDLDTAEIAQLETEFGTVVRDPRYIKLFGALLTAGDAIQEIIRDEEAS